MPKPIFGMCGSGMHINISLSKNGKNTFYDSSDKLGLSHEAYCFIAGVIEHARGMCAVTNPIVNSYKRLVPGYEAPIYIAWSAKNRSPLIRIPSAKGSATRVELRNPDPAANPYLEMAASIFAGLDGIRNSLVPPAPTDTNIFEMTKQELSDESIEMLPRTLGEAIKAFKKSSFLKEAIGEHVYTKYVAAKNEEWSKYRTRVSQWEIDEYLGKY